MRPVRGPCPWTGQTPWEQRPVVAVVDVRRDGSIPSPSGHASPGFWYTLALLRVLKTRQERVLLRQDGEWLPRGSPEWRKAHALTFDVYS